MSVYATISPPLEGYTALVILAAAAVLLICWQWLSVNLDPQEPPLVKPTIPLVGHVIGLLQYHGGYFDRLSARKCLPGVATLPMMNGKIYVITSPAFIQSAYRNKNLSFEPFMVEFSQRMLAISDETMGFIRKQDFLPEVTKQVHSSMLRDHVHRMNVNALDDLAQCMNAAGTTLELDSLYLWLRDILTMATCHALFGSRNPLRAEPSLQDAVWDFDAGLLSLTLGILPSLVAPKAYKARADLQQALRTYYAKDYHLEPDVAKLTQSRAEYYRECGMSSQEVGNIELSLLHVSVVNSIPTTFWLVAFITADSLLTTQLREELKALITWSPSQNDKREANVNVRNLEAGCPLLVSCYREVIRLVNSQLGNRRVLADTTISDGTHTYLLRAGTDVNIPAGVVHLSTAAWGPDAASFNPRRFMKLADAGPAGENAKEERRAYIPFGGGKHLCPGRNFAFAEILGFVAILVMGFDVQGRDGSLNEVPEVRRASLGAAIAPPFGRGLEMGARITRRQGWEDVWWKFTAA